VDEFYPRQDYQGQSANGQLSTTGTLSDKLAQRSHRLTRKPAPFEDGDAAASGASESKTTTEESAVAETPREQKAAANADADMDATAIEASLQADIAQASRSANRNRACQSGGGTARPAAH
jgi:hypothetical protein